MREGSPIFFLSMVPFFFSFPRAGLLVFFLPLSNAEDLRGREKWKMEMFRRRPEARRWKFPCPTSRLRLHVSCLLDGTGSMVACIASPPQSHWLHPVAFHPAGWRQSQTVRGLRRRSRGGRKSPGDAKIQVEPTGWAPGLRALPAKMHARSLRMLRRNLLVSTLPQRREARQGA